MARIQKIESDSSFNLSNVLEGKILTYKTFENGRVVHKAKLHDGSVVEITPDLSPLQAAIDTKITAPPSGTAGQFLQKTSDSTQWVDFDIYNKDQIDAFLEQISNSLSYLNDKFENYYTKQEVNGLIEGLSSDSFNQSLVNRVTALQSHQYVGQGAVKVTQESSSTLFSLTVDSNAFSNTPSGLSSLLIIKQTSNSQQGFAATYQLQGADGSPIGDKINIPKGGYQIGKGLKVTGIQLSIQSDSNTDTDKFLSIGSDTIGLKGITEAINEAVSSYTELPPIGFPGQFLQKTSNSLQWSFVDLSNYYTIEEVDALWKGSNSTNSFITITEVTNNKIYLQGLQIPIGIQTSTGNYYPIEKGSLQLGSDSVTISIAPYLAYDNTSSFQSPWIVWLSARVDQNDPDTVYTKTEVNALLRQKYDVSDASLLQQLTYSNTYGILDLQSNKLDISDAQILFNSIRQVPTGGSQGQFLQKGSNAYQWADIDLDNYYTKNEVDALIMGISDSTDLSNYYTKEEVDEKLDEFAEQLASNSAVTVLEDRIAAAEAAIALKENASDASNTHANLQTAINQKLTAPTGGSQGQFLMKTASGTAWTGIQGVTWNALTWGASVAITGSNGSLQRLSLLGNTTITPPTLNSTYQEITLQIVKNNNFTFTIQGVTLSATETVLLGWYWDGIATRRLPNIYLGD